MASSIWIAVIDVFDENNLPKTLYFSDMAYIDENQNYYEPRMQQSALVQISPEDGGTFRIFSSPSIGEVSLINIDGELNYLADYALDNGDCKLSLVEDGVKKDYLIGKIAYSHSDDKNIYLVMRSMSEVLQRNHPTAKYAGTNVPPDGVEGVTSDIKGSMKPRIFGSVKNATPILVNTARLIYQFSDRKTCTVSAVYDKGQSLTLGTTFIESNFLSFQSTAVTAGQFNRCMGFIKLGATPAGTITGDASDSVSNAGSVIEQILLELTPSISFDATSKTALDAVGAIGLFITSETSTANLLNQIIASIGGYWFFNGAIVYANLIQLATTEVLELTDSENISVERTAIGLGSNNIPVTGIDIKYNKIETVQQATDLVSTVSADRKAQLAKDYRQSLIYDSDVAKRHPLAETLKIESCLRDESAAIAVANRLLAFAKKRCDVVKITAIVSEIPVLNLGAGVLVYSFQGGYQAGKLFTICGFEIDAKRRKLTIEAFG